MQYSNYSIYIFSVFLTMISVIYLNGLPCLCKVLIKHQHMTVLFSVEAFVLVSGPYMPVLD